MRFEPIITAAIDVPAPGGDAEPNFARLPSTPGVLLLETADGATTFLGVSANVREMARRRLSPPGSQGLTRRVNQRAICSRALAATAGFPLEADACFLALARERLPTLHRAAISRWQAWFVHINPETRFPRFTRRPIPATPRSGAGAGSGAGGAPSTGLLLGPLANKHAAQRYIERLEDVFDLCRYHHILIQAPDASACAYKDMGRCPAPCDGSESLESYRKRVRAAAELNPDSRGDLGASLAAEMSAASEELDFERAESIKHRLDRLEDLAAPKFAHVRPVDSFEFLVIGRSELTGGAGAAGRVRIMAAIRGELMPLCDTGLDADVETLVEIADAALMMRQRIGAFRGSEEECEMIGLTASHLFSSAARSAGQRFIRLSAGMSRESLGTALRRAFRQFTQAKSSDPSPFAETELDTEAGADATSEDHP